MNSIGIDLGGTNIAAGIVDTNGTILIKQSVPTKAARPRDEILSDIASLCHSILQKSGKTLSDIRLIGLAVPGGVDPASGRILFTPNIPFSGINVCTILSDMLDGIPVKLVNDANAAALAEARAGAAKDAESAVMITLGTGIGGGAILHGKIYTGFNGLAAELGHMVIEKDGEACGCGRRGCFEAYASATALTRLTRKEIERCEAKGEQTAMSGDKINGRTAFEAFRKGDAAAKRVIDAYISYLSCGIVSLINIFQPEVFIIGGGISGEGQFLLDLLEPRIRREEFAREPAKRTQLRIASCGNDAGIIGAAMLEE